MTDNLPVTHKFRNINFNDNGECIVSFLVPSNLKSISVSIQTQVLNASQKKIEKYSSSSSIDLISSESKFMAVDAYLQRKGGQYLVHVLGKNGEPQFNKRIEVSFEIAAPWRKVLNTKT